MTHPANPDEGPFVGDDEQTIGFRLERRPADFAENTDEPLLAGASPWPGPQKTGLPERCPECGRADGGHKRGCATGLKATRWIPWGVDLTGQAVARRDDPGIRHFEIKGMATYDPTMKPVFAGQLTDSDWDGWHLEPELDPHGLSRLVSFATGFVIGASFGLALVWWLRRG